MSEYTQRYQGNSHQELYDALMAGKPEQIEGVAAQWAELKGILDGLSRELNGDLEKLANTWTGSAGREFHRRLGFIVAHSDALGEGMAGIKQGLTMMADHLRSAHKQAESPEETDDNDQLIGGAIKGAATFGLTGAIVGGIAGHQQDKAEQEKAHQRMVNLVADLANSYQISAYDRVVDPPPPDPDTPNGVSKDPTTPQGVSGIATVSAGPHASDSTVRGGDATGATPDRVDRPPVTGDTTIPGHDGVDGGPGAVIGPGGVGSASGTSLAGADPLVGGALVGGGAAGLLGLSGSPTVATSVNTGPSLLYAAPGGAPAGGVLRSGALAGSGGTPPPAARPTGAPAPAESRPVNGIGRSFDGQRGGGGNARPGSGSASGRPGVLGGHGRPQDDDSDDRLTWLTEDEMVWRDGDQAAPPVLGTGD
ncbi:WXG100 family type VII secretion target [Micromonospora sp. WMMD1120]|uniref:WXG100 family type VII secretion target n=1 Tax=Micromonospora sp. WMMD1120 TaxID=3016106 RepID=UPI00241703DF|nr:WXG100 family type VII secretion target [Micromonospora sp. WMMD1120]MDG4807465.1 WXG100 family type VII secretion target [Micromonospora sp. WMMD1120]